MKKLLTVEQAQQITGTARLLFEDELRLKAGQLLQGVKEGESLPELAQIVTVYDRTTQGDPFTAHEVPVSESAAAVSLQEYVGSVVHSEDWWSENLEDVASRATRRLEEWAAQNHYLPHPKRYTIDPKGTLPYLHYRHT